jgi:spore coat protein U-like protein
MRRIGSALLFAVAAFAIPQTALAGTDTDPMTVTATVIASCDVDANDLAFGSYDPVSSTPLDAATTVSVMCTTGTTYDVLLNAGTGSGASVTTRKMTSGANLLNYSLYSNAGRSAVWGTSVGSDTIAGTGNGAAQTLNVYGRIPINQTAPAGSYTDTITVTVSY